MSFASKKILEEALALPEPERERLGEALIATLHWEPVDEVERAWAEEIERRVQAAERGESTERPWDEVYAELRAKYARR